MQTALQQEYKVLMTHSPATRTNGGQRWRATLLGFPDDDPAALELFAEVEKERNQHSVGGA